MAARSRRNVSRCSCRGLPRRRRVQRKAVADSANSGQMVGQTCCMPAMEWKPTVEPARARAFTRARASSRRTSSDPTNTREGGKPRRSAKTGRPERTVGVPPLQVERRRRCRTRRREEHVGLARVPYELALTVRSSQGENRVTPAGRGRSAPRAATTRLVASPPPAESPPTRTGSAEEFRAPRRRRGGPRECGREGVLECRRVIDEDDPHLGRFGHAGAEGSRTGSRSEPEATSVQVDERCPRRRRFAHDAGDTAQGPCRHLHRRRRGGGRTRY